MKKKLFIFSFLFILFFCMVGCTQKTVDPTPKEEKSNRPVAEGVAYETKELEFYLPEDFEKSSTNGMLGVYEYYTGEWKDAGPTGIDCLILLNPVDEEFDFESYLQTAPAVTDGISLQKETINDSEWYVGHTDTVHYYYAVFHDNKYEVKISLQDDSTELYEETIQMFEKTMYLEELDEK